MIGKVPFYLGHLFEVGFQGTVSDQFYVVEANTTIAFPLDTPKTRRNILNGLSKSFPHSATPPVSKARMI